MVQMCLCRQGSTESPSPAHVRVLCLRSESFIRLFGSCLSVCLVCCSSPLGNRVSYGGQAWAMEKVLGAEREYPGEAEGGISRALSCKTVHEVGAVSSYYDGL